MIPLCVPEIRGNEWKYVKDCLDTSWVSSVGSYVSRFEEMVANRAGVRHGVATVNGTAALHIALMVAGVRPDDEVIVSDLTFIAPVNAIRYCGAHPIFIDAEPDHWQMDTGKVLDFLENECIWRNQHLENKTTGRRISAIVPVHILGHPVDMEPLLQSSRKYGVRIVEDASESLGAAYRSSPVGSLGDIACFSFNGNKIVTTGGGGMIVTDNEAWAQRARYLTTQAKDDPVEYIHHEVGYNYRLTNIQAAMGCAQIELLNEYIAKKRDIAARYDTAFQDHSSFCLLQEASWAESIQWMYTLLLTEDNDGSLRKHILQKLEKQGIQTRPLWHPMHLLPMYKNDQSFRIEHTPRLYQQSLSLPCSVGLNKDDQEQVIAELFKLVRVDSL